jgi:putative methyltransferase
MEQAVNEHGSPDVLGFSLYPWNAAYSLAVAAASREANPQTLIVAGGPSVPRRPERARRFLAENPAIDVLVFAEGELAFRELLRARSRGSGAAGFERIGGIAFRNVDGEPRFTAPPDRVHDFSAMASPFLDGTFDELCRRHRARFSMVLCETNRGCPFSCTFCDWSLTKKVVEFPLERVMAELDWAAAHGFSHIMLADANFGIRPRDIDIARRLVELRGRTGLPRSFYFYLTKNNHRRNLETIELLQSGGIGTWVGLAVQDFDDEVLAAVKRDNIQTGEAMKLRDICGERGIPTFNELILGLPGQTYASFAQTIAAAMPALPRHDFVLFLCRLIDNSELADPDSRAAFALETRRCQWKTSSLHWDPIVDEYQEVVVGTRDMPLADWRRAYRLSFLAAAFYNLRLLRVVLHHVVDSTGIDRADYLALLADHLPAAEPASVYAELDRTLERYVESLLAGGPFVLPFPGDTGGPPIGVDEALATVALRRYDLFLAETAAVTRRISENTSASETIAEAFRYQALITPLWNRSEASEARFVHDWPAYVAAGGTGAHLIARPTAVRFTPFNTLPTTDPGSFAVTHIARIRAGLDPGLVEERG